jgi:hypothetical protein
MDDVITCLLMMQTSQCIYSNMDKSIVWRIEFGILKRDSETLFKMLNFCQTSLEIPIVTFIFAELDRAALLHLYDWVVGTGRPTNVNIWDGQEVF